jgi:hypothetical protein
MSLWAWRLGLGLLLSSLLPLPPLATGDSTYATVCGKTGKYKINSTYQDNVQYVTNYLVNYPTFTAGTGFASTSYGAAPDVVYGLGLCRGDTPDNVTCYECLSTASEMAPLLCPHDKDATLFYDGCIMRISNQDFLGTMDNEPVVVLNETMTKPAALVSSFDALVGRLMNKTAEHAAASSIPTKKMATGEAVFDTDAGDDQPTKVYSLVQCTPDLTPAGCSRCLEHVLGILALRTPGSLGERVAGVRCNLRFQVYPFYVGEAMVVLEGSGSAAPSPAPMSSRPLPPPSPRAVTPPASPPNNNKKGT